MIATRQVFYFLRNPNDSVAKTHLHGAKSLRGRAPDLVEINLAGISRFETPLDLLIVEDAFNDLYEWLLPSALSTEEIRSIGICSNLQALQKLGEVLSDAPKVMTLDFELQRLSATGELIPHTLAVLRKLLERPEWARTVVVGVTYHALQSISRELLGELHANGHSVIHKGAHLSDVLPNILWDALGRHSMRSRGPAPQSVIATVAGQDITQADGKTSSPPRLSLGKSQAFRELAEQAERLALYRRLPVLLLGETGVGKGTVAKELFHRRGKFVEINCSNLSKELLESELFGHAKGAFTGADRDRPGLFEEADKGTLFLDEIGTMPLDLQSKLLKVVESREIRRIGSNKARRVDVWIIAATNEDIHQQVARGGFREDLLHRFVFKIPILPLRERREDIPDLVRFFLATEAQEMGVPVPGITDEAMKLLSRFDYPGNTRQLRNLIIQLLVNAPKQITAEAVTDVFDQDRSSNARPVASGNGRDLYRDGLDHHRSRIDQIEDLLRKGYSPHEIGRVVFPNSSNSATQRLAGFWGQKTTVRVFHNMPRTDVEQRWPRVVQDLVVRRKQTLRNAGYPTWMIALAEPDQA
jgi:transcriptional regulator with AAA-type ATPase domain